MPEPQSGEAPGQALRRHGLRPRKRLGQHFLRDRSFLRRILDAVGVAPGDQVLEIGAGTGVLTRAMAEAGARVLAVELDDALHQLLQREMSDLPNVRLWHGNALAFDPCEHLEGPYKLAGNIPYYVTGLLVRHFLESRCQPTVLVLMVQREVADRMVAAPGQLSLLGLSVQYYARPEIVARVPAGAFYPRPTVDSAIVRLTPYRSHPSDTDRDRFFELARAGFSVRRKQLGNALSSGLGIPREAARTLLAKAGIEERRRAETLSVEEWERLARIWGERG